MEHRELYSTLLAYVLEILPVLAAGDMEALLSQTGNMLSTTNSYYWLSDTLGNSSKILIL